MERMDLEKLIAEMREELALLNSVIHDFENIEAKRLEHQIHSVKAPAKGGGRSSADEAQRRLSA